MIQQRKQKLPPLVSKADKAMKGAIRKLIARHKRSGEPLIVWKNGKVTRIPAKKLISGK